MNRRPELLQFANLTPRHFTTHAVWVQVHVIDYDEPWYDDADEETFRPWMGPLPVDPGEAMFLVRARFQLADGTVLQGFLTPQLGGEGDAPDLGTLQPHIFGPTARRHSFWDGAIPRSEEARAAFYADVGKSRSGAFPISFSAEPGLSTGTQGGVIEGFYAQPAPGGPILVAR